MHFPTTRIEFLPSSCGAVQEPFATEDAALAARPQLDHDVRVLLASKGIVAREYVLDTYYDPRADKPYYLNTVYIRY